MVRSRQLFFAANDYGPRQRPRLWLHRLFSLCRSIHKSIMIIIIDNQEKLCYSVVRNQEHPFNKAASQRIKQRKKEIIILKNELSVNLNRYLANVGVSYVKTIWFLKAMLK